MMIQKLSNASLVEQTHSLFKEERRLDLEVLRHLYEIERRKLHLERGFPSLFEMCTQEFKLSPASAQRRISAMRLLKEIPEVAPKIASGELSVSVIAQTQSFFRAEKKHEREYSKQEKLNLVQSFENKSAREVEKELAARNPQVLQYESAKPVSATQTKMTVILDNETKEMLDQLRDLISHANPEMTYEGVIKRAAKLLLEKELKKVQPLKLKQQKTSLMTSLANEETSAEDSKTHAEMNEHQIQFEETTPLGQIPFEATTSTHQISLPTSEGMVQQSFAAEDLKIQNQKVDQQNKRRPSSALRRKIWMRDHGKCTHRDHMSGKQCNSKSFLQIDHVQPWSMNGKTTEQNLRLLCGAHNRTR